MEEDTKRKKIMEEDRITALPDDILHSILSLVPIRDAARIAVLSRRWRYLAKSLSNLHFESDNILGDRFPLEYFHELDNVNERRAFSLERKLEFVKAVDQFLESRPCSIKMKSLRICMSLETTYTSFLDKWIAHAFSSGIEELHLQLCEWEYGLSDVEVERYSFPFHMLTHREASLKCLTLEYVMVRCPPNFHGFKSLTTLSFIDVKVSLDDLGEILSTCSILERLSLVSCSLVSLEIPCSCSRLKHLKIINCDGLKNVSINAPNITTFVYTGSMRNISFGESLQLKHIEYNYKEDMLDGIECVFGRLPHIVVHLESLKLYFCSYKKYIETKSFPEYFPQFAKLKQLQMKCFLYSYCDLLWRIPFLRACPFLEELRLKIVYCRAFRHSHYREEVMELVPRCPLELLKRVKINGFSGFWHEIAFASLLLKNAVNLETMIIDCHHKCYGEDEKQKHMNMAKP
ncbi:putative FBD-associated F-box protein [Acorus calamus]|uniref:FBD-associated F-box protein n=1 Tax=Acorus calamus TaxID=4465 RepID=A0AAV9EIW7_ACOCL|nr:putative FBD-associated F-box protein [Acorus calamus]